MMLVLLAALDPEDLTIVVGLTVGIPAEDPD